MIDEDLDKRSRWVLALILGSAILFRFWNLGGLGFYGDEETTALAASSLASGDGLRLPSGMPYVRGILLSAVAALTALFVGPEYEIVYRWFPALCGTATIVLMYQFGSRLFDRRVAVIAALLIAVSEWHILTSREARMYAPFLLVFTASVFSSWLWVKEGNRVHGALSTVFAGVALTLHELGAFCAVMPWVWYLVDSASRQVVKLKAMTVYSSAIVGFYWIYNVLWIRGTYSQFRSNAGNTAAELVNASMVVPPAALVEIWAIGLGGLGIVIGILLALRTAPNGREIGLDRVLWVCSIAIGAGFAAGGFMHAWVLCWTAAFLLVPLSIRDFVVRGKMQLALLCVPIAVHLWLLFDTGASWLGLRQIFDFPYPYVLYFFDYSPGLFLLFLGGLLWLLLGRRTEPTAALRAAALVALGVPAALGLVSKWGGMRYLIPAYPFVLLLASYCFVRSHEFVQEWTPRWGKAFGVAAVAFCVAGGLGGHGLYQAGRAAFADYGSRMDFMSFGYPIYPDHRNPGRFVRDSLVKDDLVVAEDALEQGWYVGRVDYWLRNPEAAAPFLYQTATGELRDIYANSQLLSSGVFAELAQTAHRVWIVTSAETDGKRDYYLSPQQQAWLDSVDMIGPVFVARDAATKVYCVKFRVGIPAACSTKVGG